jgi:hypothetical protein
LTVALREFVAGELYAAVGRQFADHRVDCGAQPTPRGADRDPELGAIACRRRRLRIAAGQQPRRPTPSECRPRFALPDSDQQACVGVDARA